MQFKSKVIYYDDTMASKEKARGKEEKWLPEQQLKELKRRMDASNSDMSHTKPSFQPNPGDVIVAIPQKVDGSQICEVKLVVASMLDRYHVPFQKLLST